MGDMGKPNPFMRPANRRALDPIERAAVFLSLFWIIVTVAAVLRFGGLA